MPVAKTKKIEIEITEAQEKFLKEFAAKQYPGSDDNASTICPIHAVQVRRERIIDPNYNDPDKITYYNGENEIEFNSLEEVVEYYYEDENIDFTIIPYEKAEWTDIIGSDGELHHIYDENDYLDAYGIERNYVDKCYIEYYYENVAYFFIKDEAKDYMKYQSHNLTSPRIYTFGPGYSNYGDYIPFWNLLMSIGQELNEVKGNDINKISTEYKDKVI